MAFLRNKVSISKKLDLKRLPKHLAIILDGNGRWATKRGLPRNAGHKAGCENLKRIAEFIYNLGIYCTTFFVFSTENWKRPQEEVEGIFNIVREYLNESVDEFIQKDVRINAIGDTSKLPQDLLNKLNDSIEKTKSCKSHILNLAINYGGRDEMLMAMNKAIDDGKKLQEVNDIQKYLYTADIPDPDFVIRTSGEMRISNFMLYQMAYSELYFTKRLWPDFSSKDLTKALLDYQGRKRRYGGLDTKEKK